MPGSLKVIVEEEKSCRKLKVLNRLGLAFDAREYSWDAGGRLLRGPQPFGDDLVVPSESEPCLEVPVELFTQGWAYVLTTSEIAAVHG